MWNVTTLCMSCSCKSPPLTPIHSRELDVMTNQSFNHIQCCFFLETHLSMFKACPVHAYLLGHGSLDPGSFAGLVSRRGRARLGFQSSGSDRKCRRLPSPLCNRRNKDSDKCGSPCRLLHHVFQLPSHSRHCITELPLKVSFTRTS